MHNWVAEKVFDRELWTPSERSVARGMAIGLFVSMFLVPFQMVIAGALACYLHAVSGRRINLPVAVAAVWVSNPATYVPVFLLQRKVGLWIYQTLPIPALPRFPGTQAQLAGTVVTAVAACAIGYFGTILLWELISKYLLSPPVLRRIPRIRKGDGTKR